MKICKCSTHIGANPLPESEFGKNKRMADGLHYSCKACIKRLSAKRYQKDKDKIKRRVAKWQKQNKSKVNEASRRYRGNNPEKRKQITKQWRDKNRQLSCYLANKRRAAKQKATPPWANESAILTIYQNCPTGCHVHHIVPLQECPSVCGLHCESNLVILSETQHKNLHTNNHYLEDSWLWDVSLFPRND